MPAVLRHIANLWTLLGHPSPEREWSLEAKLEAIRSAGFDGVCWAALPGLKEAARRLGLLFLGGMASGDAASFSQDLTELKAAGARHINVQLAGDDVRTPEALSLTLELMQAAERLDLLAAIESHRGTCTETPEKLYALADAYQQATGRLLPISWDFSHFAVVKHLVPSSFGARLLLRPDLIAHAQQFHFRPFNGHHAQVPITNGHGELTQEMSEWLPFAEAVFRCWLRGNTEGDRELLICPELGPLEGGYALSTFPNSWEEAQVLRLEVDKLWRKVTA